MLIDPANITRLPAPPPRGSATEAGEINELVGLTRRQKDPRTAEALPRLRAPQRRQLRHPHLGLEQQVLL
jgi:hypothetical protein